MGIQIKTPIIEMSEVYKTRGNREIGPINLTIEPGYVVALAGHNGSGKSTLIHLLTQLIHPDFGEIRWFGQAYPDGMPADTRQWVGYVSEQPTREEDRLTAEAAAAFRALWYPGWDETRFQRLMERFQVPQHTKLSRMSKGERRKFELAAALAPHPRLLLLDEPSSGLDPFAWKIMLEELRDCMENGKTTVIIATHIIDEIKRLADYIVLMHDGRLLGKLEKDHLLENSKEMWFEGTPEEASELPGVVETESEGGLQRIVTLAAGETSAILEQAGIRPIRVRRLELDDILVHWSAGQLSEDAEIYTQKKGAE
ncbi:MULTISPECIES: ATP-binding cassette domain-containing protein [Paenibacillus]|uniref:ATP-binding cassette domain-containing protein n=1 Tax=Paenibacillus TaxID=44249 RepID=UPI0008FB773D|nr:MULTISPECIES: ABC transporter ATP-binding protein [Paenibacillus]APB78491.1 energy-coupling factor transporter ATPase [Paenibacillus polymyxa]OMF79182.1 multidrug ABC transporter ATP-binding protein [Paenibacillus peoriae]POR28299.1 ABC transporter ATP-binding protein [Paenibacillus polymyxa]